VSIQRYTTASGAARYRARVKSHGRVVASSVFLRRADAVAWEQDQYRRLRSGEWLDPRRGRVDLEVVAEAWLASRVTVKRRTLESDQGIWRNYIAPRWRHRPVASITTAEVSTWMGELMARGLARSTVTRARSHPPVAAGVRRSGREGHRQRRGDSESPDRRPGGTRRPDA
jgi:hypothetical protein